MYKIIILSQLMIKSEKYMVFYSVFTALKSKNNKE